MSYILTKKLLDAVFEEAKASSDVDDFNERIKAKEPLFEELEISKLRKMVKRYVSIDELKTNTIELLKTNKPIVITKNGKDLGIIIPSTLLK